MDGGMAKSMTFVDMYREAKGLLFAALARPSTKRTVKSAVVNADDPSANFMLERAAGARPIRFGIEARDADVLARRRRGSHRAQAFDFHRHRRRTSHERDGKRKVPSGLER